MTLTIISLIVTAVAALGAIRWYTFWKPHAVKFSQSGYTPPDTSWFGKLCFDAACRFLVFMTVGRVKVFGRENLPDADGHLIFASNHQLPCDFAMLRRGAGRHFRMLTASAELGGFFGVISAFLGVISVSTGKSGEGAAAEASCVKVVAKKKGALGIFPQGALLPDNVLRKEEFRPGIVRMAKSAQRELDAAAPRGSEGLLFELLGIKKRVQIVPMAVYYRHDPVYADWTHRPFKKTRSMFLGMRNPRHWDPIFKLDVETLAATEREEVERQREVKLKAYRKSHVTNYGGVVVIGKPITADELPEDPLAAVEVIRLRIADLLLEAQQR